MICAAAGEDVLGDIAMPLPVVGEQQSLASQVVGVDVGLAVAGAVILLESTRALDQ